ncbi:MAG: murein hydrolase activator EnvC [Lysobacterales bacterium]
MLAGILLGFLLVSTAAGQSGDRQRLEQQLEEVRQKLTQLQGQLQESQQAFAAETAALREVELAISDTRNAITHLNSDIDTQSQAITDLDQRAKRLSDGLRTQTRQLASAVRYAWASGQGSALRALLSIDEVSGASRQWQYQRLIAAAQARQLNQIKDNLTDLVQVRSEAASRRDTLKGQRESQSSREANLLKQKTERRRAANALNAAIKRQQRESANLTADTQRLNQLIEELVELFADIPSQLDGDPGLPPPAGTLRLPVAGKVLQGAGVAKPGGMHRLGLLISATAGSPVSAMSYGRVAYADWLRGFGLLIIIDHGDGYLSLYAFNESLYREVGDWVSAGDRIATAGASGGRSNPALYFELRRNGQPVDPRPWLE